MLCILNNIPYKLYWIKFTARFWRLSMQVTFHFTCFWRLTTRLETEIQGSERLQRVFAIVREMYRTTSIARAFSRVALPFNSRCQWSIDSILHNNCSGLGVQTLRQSRCRHLGAPPLCWWWQSSQRRCGIMRRIDAQESSRDSEGGPWDKFWRDVAPHGCPSNCVPAPDYGVDELV